MGISNNGVRWARGTSNYPMININTYIYIFIIVYIYIYLVKSARDFTNRLVSPQKVAGRKGYHLIII